MIDSEMKNNVQGAVLDINQRLNFSFYGVAYDWASKKEFCEIVEESGQEEGNILKNIF